MDQFIELTPIGIIVKIWYCPLPRQNDWPTSLGSSNGKAYDTALVLQWMGDFLESYDSLSWLVIPFLYITLIEIL